MKAKKTDQEPEKVLIVGGGIAGLHAASYLADLNYEVALVEKGPAVGGALPRLFRTYPECACCRIYGKMLDVVNHPKVTTFTLAEVADVSQRDGVFTTRINVKPRYINPARCIVCHRCAEVCPAEITIDGGFEWGSRKAAYIPYPQAVPYSYCIDASNCLYFQNGSCRECENACPTDAIQLEAEEKTVECRVSSIILATGFELPDTRILNRYGYQFPNVVTAVEFERLLSPQGPTGGKLLRPSDATPPGKIAWIQCVGSRDRKEPECSHCSSVCCMFAIKEALSAKEELGDDVDTDIYFMDVRAFGKGFEEYTGIAKEKNVRFRYSRIHSVLPGPGKDQLVVTSHNQDSDMVESTEYDLVVLSAGFKVPQGVKELFGKLDIQIDASAFAETESFAPVTSNHPGIFVCGSVSGPKDIYDSMVEAAATVSEIVTRSKEEEKSPPDEDKIHEEKETRIGVFLCTCPTLQNDLKEMDQIAQALSKQAGVLVSQGVKILCTEEGMDTLKKTVKAKKINRVVITSCAQTVHKSLLERALREYGVRPQGIDVIDLNDYVSRDNSAARSVHGDRLTMELKRRIEKINSEGILPVRRVPVKDEALVVGGGISGMEYALCLADRGYTVHLVEKTASLGGKARWVWKTWRKEELKPYLKDLINRVKRHPNIKLYLNSTVTSCKGFVGNFKSLVSSLNGNSPMEVSHGVIHLATGAEELKPSEYRYGEDTRIITLGELEEKLALQVNKVADYKNVVFIQCVGSREPERPYCSRVCCSRALLNALILKTLKPDVNITVVHRDIRTYGTRERLYQEALDKGIFFIRYDPSGKPRVDIEEDGALSVRVQDRIIDTNLSFSADLVILSTAAVPDNEEVARVFSVDLDDNGFFKESHTKMRPTQFYRQGITMSGAAHGPKFIDESIAQAKAAATHALSILTKDFIEVGGSVAVVDRARCAVCCTCVRVCPFDVPRIERSVSVIDETKCQGCGACVAECPGKAISLVQYEDEYILSECRGCFA